MVGKNLWELLCLHLSPRRNDADKQEQPTPLGKVTATDASGAAQQGSSVSLSSDGNTVIVGGPGDNNGQGAAWVYTSSGSGWTQQGKLVGTDVSGAAQQGASVALSADGNTAIVGGPGDTNGLGAAWVYTRSGGVWTQQGTKLSGSDVSGAALQGSSVALSSDGSTAIVGGPGDGGGAGAVWVFVTTPAAPPLVMIGPLPPATTGLPYSQIPNRKRGNAALRVVRGERRSAKRNCVITQYRGAVGNAERGRQL